MNRWDTLRYTVINNRLWWYGKPVIKLVLCLLLVGFLVHPLFYGIAIVIGLVSFYFFRVPYRSAPAREHDAALIVSPADGRIINVNVIDGDEYGIVLTIELSFFDALVQWAPYSGRVATIRYTPSLSTGVLTPARALSEHNDITIYCEVAEGVVPKGDEHDGAPARITIRQIAGTLASRIIWWVGEDQPVRAGDHLGMIPFGFGVELFLPHDTAVYVQRGDRLRGGHTIIGRRAVAREFRSV